MNGVNPLDASAVHPEAYPVVERIVVKTGVPVTELVGKSAVLALLVAALTSVTPLERGWEARWGDFPVSAEGVVTLPLAPGSGDVR